MRNTQPRKIEAYRMPNGRVPFTEWFGLIQFEIKEHRRALRPGLFCLSRAILVITALSVTVFLNSVSMLGQAIVSILVK